jgi:fumarate hydratase, class I
MEAIHEFVVETMPVTVAVDSTGASIHKTGPSKWRRPVITVFGSNDATFG